MREGKAEGEMGERVEVGGRRANLKRVAPNINCKIINKGGVFTFVNSLQNGRPAASTLFIFLTPIDYSYMPHPNF